MQRRIQPLQVTTDTLNEIQLELVEWIFIVQVPSRALGISQMNKVNFCGTVWFGLRNTLCISRVLSLARVVLVLTSNLVLCAAVDSEYHTEESCDWL
jgi:hypothetical protein